MVLTTGRLLEPLACRHDDAARERSDALEPEAIAGLNPRDMDKMGIGPGDMVSVATRRGEIVLKARALIAIRRRVWCSSRSHSRRRRPSALTNPQLDPMGKIPEFKFCACKMRRLQTRNRG